MELFLNMLGVGTIHFMLKFWNSYLFEIKWVEYING